MSDDQIDCFDYYRSEYPLFRDAVRRAMLVSYGSGAIQTAHVREKYCALLFTKLTVSSRSLLALCPDPTSPEFVRAEIDFSSSAALARVCLDTFVSLFHLGIEDCPEDEFKTRQLLIYWRDFRVRMRMGVYSEPEVTSDFHATDLRQRLDANPFWKSLPEKRRKHLLKKNDLLHSADEIMRRAGADVDQYKLYYAYWSAHAHCDSVAFLFMGENNRGMGQINVRDVGLLGGCIEYIRVFLNAASSEVDRIFAGAEARAKSVENLDPFANRGPPPP